ncbi:MAG: hypothetical protein K5663_03650 [Clostridiales bacterium]|nr:hypothetical protein [Clostridiales bacterium]
MDASKSGADLAVRTAFSERYDLLQIMRGLEAVPGQNSPVDFRLAALCDKEQADIWHADRVLAFSTDECPPLVINGEDIGGNHGQPCLIRVTAPAHKLSEKDTGSLWKDESGLGFTLMKTESRDTLLFLSDNIGTSEMDYRFADRITGCLTPVDTDSAGIVPWCQECGIQLIPAIRHTERKALFFKDGKSAEIKDEVKGCDRVEIRETYEIINPATVAEAIRKAKNRGEITPPLNEGKALARMSLVYRFEDDGTVITEFGAEALRGTKIDCFLGIMHQLKCDAFGGGVSRYIPGLKPVTKCGKTYDFSHPYTTRRDTMPERLLLTSDTWFSTDAPPDRQIDFLSDENGRRVVGFASGYLPVADGEPSYRARHITEAGTLVKSCKSYPTFLGGELNAQRARKGKGDALGFSRIRGAAYRKYFTPTCDDALMYTIPYNDEEYVYMDHFADEPRRLELKLRRGQTAQTLFSNLPCIIENGRVLTEGCVGSVCLRVRGTK